MFLVQLGTMDELSKKVGVITKEKECLKIELDTQMKIVDELKKQLLAEKKKNESPGMHQNPFTSKEQVCFSVLTETTITLSSKQRWIRNTN
jgi:hypothetical protein